MLKLLLLLTLFLLFYSLTVGEFPDTYSWKEKILHHTLSVGGMIGAFIIGTALFSTPIAGIFWGIMGWFAPGWIIGARNAKRHTNIRSLARDYVASAAGLYAVGQMSSDVLRVMADRFAEPLATEFQEMVAKRNMNPGISYPKLFSNLAEKYKLSEFKAVASILAASEQAGGPVAASKGLKRLGNALRQRDKLLTERAKATMEPKIAATVVIAILVAGLILDATALRQMFDNSAGKIILGISSGLVVGLIFMVKKIMLSE